MEREAKNIAVGSMEQAWTEAGKLFPTHYELDAESSARASPVVISQETPVEDSVGSHG